MKPNNALAAILESHHTVEETMRCCIADVSNFSLLDADLIVERLNERGVVFGEKDSQFESFIQVNNISHSMRNFELADSKIYADVKLMGRSVNKPSTGFCMQSVSDAKFAMRSMVNGKGEHNVITFDLVP